MSALTAVLLAVLAACLLLAGALVLGGGALLVAAGLLTRLVEALAPALLVVWFVVHGRRGAPGWQRLPGTRYAHRGLHGPGVPENSLPAFRAAAEAGYGAELDVHLTADGRLAVFHDGTLARMCGVEGTVEEFSSKILRELRLAGTTETIPFLEEVVPLFAGRPGGLIVELKSAGGNHAALAEATLRCLDRFSVPYCVESFDPRCLLWLRRHRPEVLRGQLMQNFLKRPEGLSLWNRLALTGLFYNVAARPDFVAVRFEDRTLPAVRLCRTLGAREALWTLRTAQELEAAEREGALAIFENVHPKEEGKL